MYLLFPVTNGSNVYQNLTMKMLKESMTMPFWKVDLFVITAVLTVFESCHNKMKSISPLHGPTPVKFTFTTYLLT
jgi:hypothetical protein